MKATSPYHSNNQIKLRTEVKRIHEELAHEPADKKEFEYLVHALNNYQAELEIQNQTLIDTLSDNDLLREYYQSLFTHLPLPAITLDRKLKILELNKEAKSLLSYGTLNTEQVTNFSNVFDATSTSKLYQAIAQLSDQSANNRVKKFEMANNTSLFRVILTCINTEDDERFMLVFFDQTVQEAFAAQTSFLYSVIKSSRDTLIALDLDGNLVLDSNEITSASELSDIGNYQPRLFESPTLPPEILQLIHKYVHQRTDDLASTGKLVEVVNSANNSEWFRVDIFPIEIKGRMTNIGVAISNHTTFVQQEEDLRLAVQIFNEGNQGFFVTDDKKNILRVNNAYETITEFCEEEVVGTRPKLSDEFSRTGNMTGEIWREVKESGVWEGEVWNRRKNGERYAQWISIFSNPPKAQIVRNYVAVFRDITEKKTQEAKISELAYYDKLTACGNRTLLEIDVRDLICDELPFSVLFIDLDHFKLVNDIHGHDIGDELLRAFTARIKHIIRKSDSLYRLGGDEFLIIIKNCGTKSVSRKASHIIKAASSPFFVSQLQLNISASIGIAQYPDDGKDFITLLKHADTALYSAKEAGRRRFDFFNDKVLAQVSRRAEIQHELNDALARNEFSLLLMPQLCLETKKFVQAEALLRWTNRKLGSVSPVEFIPVAESSGVIHNITYFVLGQVLNFVQTAQKSLSRPISFAVNVSTLDIKDEAFFHRLTAMLSQTSELNRFVTVELTESIFMEDYVEITKRLHHLKTLGVSVSIDDFGTGYSSLAYLNNLPIDELKIDKRFIDEIETDDKAKAICKAIISMAHAMGYSSVAEGVETQAQLEWLSKEGCELS